VSGIFGVVRLGDHAPDSDAWQAMAAAMAPWGDVPPTRADLGGAAFGHSLRPETPEDAHCRMPAAHDDRRVLVTAEGRLDNRDELTALLGIPAAEAAALADAGLMARAYLRWGEDCAPRLRGDWSLAAWHPREQRLALVRDHLGITALYHHVDRAAGRVVFASDPRALHAAGVPRRLNELRLAATLIAWGGDDPEGTIDLDVARVPPAHVVVVTPRAVGGRRYWSPPTEASEGMSADDSAEGLLAVLDQAVRSRCRSAGPLAVTLSGGLDSGSVTALAARHLAAVGRQLPAAYTAVPIGQTAEIVGATRFGDESEFASATAAAAGITDHRLLDSAAISPMQGIEWALSRLDQPAHAAGNAFWLGDILRSARAGGQRSLLTGQGGNATISWTGGVDGLWRSGRWRDLGPRGVAGYLAPAPVYRRRQAGVLGRAQWPSSSIEPAFADRLRLPDLVASSLGHGADLLPRATPLQHRAAIVQPGSTRVGDLWSRNATGSGLDVRDPTQDVTVVEFSFTIPDRHFRGPDGIDRWVLRRAMAGLLPDEVRLNRRRGRQAADIVERLRRSGDEVEAALAEVAGGVSEEWVSGERLRAAWDAVRGSNDSVAMGRAVTVLTRGVMAALWLTRTHG